MQQQEQEQVEQQLKFIILNIIWSFKTKTDSIYRNVEM